MRLENGYFRICDGFNIRFVFSWRKRYAMIYILLFFLWKTFTVFISVLGYWKWWKSGYLNWIDAELRLKGMEMTMYLKKDKKRGISDKGKNRLTISPESKIKINALRTIITLFQVNFRAINWHRETTSRWNIISYSFRTKYQGQHKLAPWYKSFRLARVRTK